MNKRVLYNLAIPEEATMSTEKTSSQKLYSEGSVTEDGTTVESVSLQPGEYMLRGQYRGRLAEKLSNELEQLFSADGYKALPFYSTDTTRDDGYYALKNINSGPLARNEPRVQSFDGILKKKGTRSDYWRAIKTGRLQVENPFGSSIARSIAVHSDAGKVRWFDGMSSVESASATDTMTSEFGDVDVYDAEDSSYNNPVLIYSIPYASEGRADPCVFDTDGNADKFITSEDPKILQWRRVFTKNHEYDGSVVFDNGLLRVEMDESAGEISAERYSSGSWSSVSLTASDWSVWDVDVYRINQHQCSAQVTFFNAGNTPEYYIYNMTLFRGRDNIQITDPSGQTSQTTASLDSMLENIADDETLDPEATVSLVQRSEVRK